MNNIYHEYTWTDALLLHAIAYCQRHNETATLARILLTTDAINRSWPTHLELEEGLNRFSCGGHIELQPGCFRATNAGLRMFDDVSKPHEPQLNVFEQIGNLADRLRSGPQVPNVSKQLIIADAQYAAAVRETHNLFEEMVSRSTTDKSATYPSAKSR